MKDILGNEVCEGDFVAYAVGSSDAGALRLGYVVGTEKKKYESVLSCKIKGIDGARGGLYREVLLVPEHWIKLKFPDLKIKK